MAASIELSAFIAGLSQWRKFDMLLDLGSGFSSYALRTYQKASIKKTRVYSVDDDAQWLIKTVDFLKGEGVSTEDVMGLRDFYAQNISGFDFILCDLNYVEERIKHVDQMVDKIKPGGIVIFDDVHKADYQYELLQKLKSYTGDIYDLSPVTLDQFGRYSFAFIKQ